MAIDVFLERRWRWPYFGRSLGIIWSCFNTERKRNFSLDIVIDFVSLIFDILSEKTIIFDLVSEVIQVFLQSRGPSLSSSFILRKRKSFRWSLQLNRRRCSRSQGFLSLNESNGPLENCQDPQPLPQLCYFYLPNRWKSETMESLSKVTCYRKRHNPAKFNALHCLCNVVLKFIIKTSIIPIRGKPCVHW